MGIKKEDVLNKEVGVKVMEKLKALKHEVVYCTPSNDSSLNNSLYRRVNKANEEKVDFYVSIHFNAKNIANAIVNGLIKEVSY